MNRRKEFQYHVISGTYCLMHCIWAKSISDVWKDLGMDNLNWYEDISLEWKETKHFFFFLMKNAHDSVKCFHSCAWRDFPQGTRYLKCIQAAPVAAFLETKQVGQGEQTAASDGCGTRAFWRGHRHQLLRHWASKSPSLPLPAVQYSLLPPHPKLPERCLQRPESAGRARRPALPEAGDALPPAGCGPPHIARSAGTERPQGCGKGRPRWGNWVDGRTTRGAGQDRSPDESRDHMVVVILVVPQYSTATSQQRPCKIYINICWFQQLGCQKEEKRKKNLLQNLG